MLLAMKARMRYAEHRPYAVPDRLEELTGPTGGLVSLPIHLDWSGTRRPYDLRDAAERNIMYERVLREAAGSQDLHRYLNAEVLLKVWQDLYLPPQVRAAWERRFPQLAHRRHVVARGPIS